MNGAGDLGEYQTLLDEAEVFLHAARRTGAAHDGPVQHGEKHERTQRSASRVAPSPGGRQQSSARRLVGGPSESILGQSRQFCWLSLRYTTPRIAPSAFSQAGWYLYTPQPRRVVAAGKTSATTNDCRRSQQRADRLVVFLTSRPAAQPASQDSPTEEAADRNAPLRILIRTNIGGGLSPLRAKGAPRSARPTEPGQAFSP